MSTTFKNAPLIELIAELRWNVHSPPLGTPQTPLASIALMALNANQFDEFFMRFGGEVYKLGYERAERLLPSGFPYINSAFAQAGRKIKSVMCRRNRVPLRPSARRTNTSSAPSAN